MSILKRILAPLLKLPRFWLSVGILGGWLIVMVVLIIASTGRAPSQPLAFNHRAHISNNIQCLFCHTGANRGPSATIPNMEKCQYCHQQIEPSSDALVALKGYLDRKEVIPWVPVTILPDFVYFSHRPHLAAELNCETCHGNIGTMGVAQPQRMDMGWCITCHRAHGGDRVEKLIDCANCHK